MIVLLLAGALALLGLAAPRRARRFVELTIITCNDDWASKGSNLAELLAHGFDLLFIQEGKRAVYRTLSDSKTGARLLPITKYGVHQDTKSLARAGSVVVWDHTTIRRTGSGFTFGVKAPGLLARWVAWLRATAGGRRLWPASAHRPPVRVRRWWDPFDVALIARTRLALAARRFPIIGMDCNEHGGPARLKRSLKALRWHAVGDSIDGFLLHRKIEVLSITELPKDTSDHHPVVARIRIPVGRAA